MENEESESDHDSPADSGNILCVLLIVSEKRIQRYYRGNNSDIDLCYGFVRIDNCKIILLHV